MRLRMMVRASNTAISKSRDANRRWASSQLLMGESAAGAGFAARTDLLRLCRLVFKIRSVLLRQKAEHGKSQCGATRSGHADSDCRGCGQLS